MKEIYWKKKDVIDKIASCNKHTEKLAKALEKEMLVYDVDDMQIIDSLHVSIRTLKALISTLEDPDCTLKEYFLAEEVK